MSSENPEVSISTCLHKGSKQFWAMPFDPEAVGVKAGGTVAMNKQNPGLKGIKIELDHATLSGIARDRRTFERCWFTGSLADLDVSNWTFIECTFDHSSWHKVKFSNCAFRRCHFFKLELTECAFMESCSFQDNSVSPELVWMKDTMINASALLNSVTTNLEHLPTGVSAEYQKWRLVTTKANIAMLIYGSTRNEPNLAFYSAAQKELVLADLNWRIERHRYWRDTRSGRPKERERHKLSFHLRTVTQRLERQMVRAAGSLTQWGQSVSRPCLVLFFLVVAFGFIYDEQGWVSQPEGATAFVRRCCALLKALNITLVAGFTAYFDPKGDLLKQVAEVSNVVAGIFWYSLIVPVLARKVLR